MGVHTISPLSGLPTITDPVTIDGYTQAGAVANTLATGDNAILLIELDGSMLPGNFYGLYINGGGSTIKGLVINRFKGIGGGTAIGIGVKGNNLIAGNFIGTNAAGTAKAANDFGVFILAAAATLSAA